jgi:hypothetical protein
MDLSHGTYVALTVVFGAIIVCPVAIALVLARLRRLPRDLGRWRVRAFGVMLAGAAAWALFMGSATRVIVLRDADGSVAQDRGYHLGLDLHWSARTRLVNHSSRQVVVIELTYTSSAPLVASIAEPPSWPVAPGETFVLDREIDYFGPDDEPPASMMIRKDTPRGVVWVTGQR